MNSVLHRLADNGDISWLSYYFAEFVTRIGHTQVDGLLGHSAALVSEANLAGNVCIRLDRYSQQPLFKSQRVDLVDIPMGFDAADWGRELCAGPCVGGANDNQPLMLEAGRLYLKRWWQYESTVASKILALLQHRIDIDPARLESQIKTVFSDTKEPDLDQIKAVRQATNNAFCIISGGPGSGKTSTVVRILAVIKTLEPKSRIALAAPTGKAAARMLTSIRQNVDQSEHLRAIADSLPAKAETIHRLLGYRKRNFTAHEKNSLPFDCIIIDESSMVDLKLMYHLLQALAPGSRLILLGDRDQLAAVAAGNVLGDITGHGRARNNPNALIPDSMVLLRNNYRFDNASAIGELADQVNRNQRRGAISLLERNDRGLCWFEQADDKLQDAALDWLVAAYQPIFACETPAAALAIYQKTRILTATNQGALGVTTINQTISHTLLARNQKPLTEYYSGLPIMVTRNHHQLGLFNGDTGILWWFGDGLYACFHQLNGDIRRISLSRMPDFEPAWATTVHKAQGEEFDSVLLILPPDPESEALSRELLYTAITRARRQFLLQASRQVVARTIDKLTRRDSGLAQKLGWSE